MNKDEMKGKIGEILVSEYLTDKGFIVKLSENKYDEEKDMTILHKESMKEIAIEVKTMVLIKYGRRKEGSAGYGSNQSNFNSGYLISEYDSKGKYYHNQVNKCKSVEGLIFVYAEPDNDGVVRLYSAGKPNERQWYPWSSKKSPARGSMILLKDLTLLAEYNDKSLYNQVISNSTGKPISFYENQYRKMA